MTGETERRLIGATTDASHKTGTAVGELVIAHGKAGALE
jgi:hypothetical protein